MSWFDDLADNPSGALEALAHRRGCSVVELCAHHAKLLDTLDESGELGHLTLNELLGERLDDGQTTRSDTAERHLSHCHYCRELAGALGAKTLQPNPDIIWKQSHKPSTSSQPDYPVHADKPQMRLTSAPPDRRETLNAIPAVPDATTGRASRIHPLISSGVSVALSLLVVVIAIHFYYDPNRNEMLQSAEAELNNSIDELEALAARERLQLEALAAQERSQLAALGINDDLGLSLRAMSEPDRRAATREIIEQVSTLHAGIADDLENVANDELTASAALREAESLHSEFAKELELVTAAYALEALDLAAVSRDLGFALGSIEGTLNAVTDAESARNAVPELIAISETVNDFVMQLRYAPAAERQILDATIDVGLARIQPIVDEVLVSREVAVIIKPVLEPLLRDIDIIAAL